MQPTPVLSLGSDLWNPSLSFYPPLVPAGRWADKPLGLVSPSRHRSSLWESVCFALCTPVAALSSMAPKLPPRHPPSLPVKGLPRVWKLFLLHSSHSVVQVPFLFFCLCFFFWPTQVHGEFLVFWEVWSLLPAFSRCSVGVVPHVDVVLMYLCVGRWSPCLTPLPSWRSVPSVDPWVVRDLGVKLKIHV